MFTVEVLQRVEQMDKKRERDRRQRELDGGGGGAGGGAAWGDGGSPERLAQGFHSRGNAQVAATAAAAQAQADADAGYGVALGRTGIFVTHEGYLMKKTASTPHRWQRKWFSVVTKENNGLVDSRTMQYYDKKPPEGRETEVSTDDLLRWLT